jgi:hypothetical protein
MIGDQRRRALECPRAQSGACEVAIAIYFVGRGGALEAREREGRAAQVIWNRAHAQSRPASGDQREGVAAQTLQYESTGFDSARRWIE